MTTLIPNKRRARTLTIRFTYTQTHTLNYEAFRCPLQRTMTTRPTSEIRTMTGTPGMGNILTHRSRQARCMCRNICVCVMPTKGSNQCLRTHPGDQRKSILFPGWEAWAAFLEANPRECPRLFLREKIHPHV